MIDKLEIGQVREWRLSARSSFFTVDYVGSRNCIGQTDGIEMSCINDYALKYSILFKPEPKEIKVKWYRDNGSIFCTDTDYQKSKHWAEIDFIDGKFYEKEIK